MILIRDVTNQDSESIADIYNHYIKNTTYTFEEELISASEIGSRIAKIQREGLPWLIAEVNGKIVGYAYAAKWKERSAYRFSVESTVYVDPNSLGKGVGTHLYRRLFTELKSRGINSVVGGITLPNLTSVGLHEKLGMEKVAHFKSIGFKFGSWRDVGYWQLHLDGHGVSDK